MGLFDRIRSFFSGGSTTTTQTVAPKKQESVKVVDVGTSETTRTGSLTVTGGSGGSGGSVTRKTGSAKSLSSQEVERATGAREQKTTVRDLAARQQDPVRALDVGSQDRARVGGFTLVGTQFQDKPVVVKGSERAKMFEDRERIEVELELEEDPQTSLKKSITPTKESGFNLFRTPVEKFFELSGFVAEDVLKLPRGREFSPQTSEKIVDFSTDIAKFAFFAPAFATTAETVIAQSADRVFFAGTQKNIGDKIVTQLKFTSAKGSKGQALGITRSQIVKDFEGSEFVASKTLGIGRNFKRGLEFPTGRIVKKPSSSFVGVDTGLAKQFDGKFIEASLGKVKVFKSPKFTGKSDTLNVKSFGFGVSKEQFNLLVGASKTDLGTTVSGGIIKQTSRKGGDFGSSIASFGKGGGQVIDKTALKQTQNIVTGGISKKPSVNLKTSTLSSTSTFTKQDTPTKVVSGKQFNSLQQLNVKDVLSVKSVVGSVGKTDTRTSQKLFSGLRQRDILATSPKLNVGQATKTKQKPKSALRFRQNQIFKTPRGRGFLFPRFKTPKGFFPPLLPPLLAQERRTFTKKSKRKFKETTTLAGALAFDLGLQEPKGRTKKQQRLGVPLESPFKKTSLPTILIGDMGKKKKNKKGLLNIDI